MKPDPRQLERKALDWIGGLSINHDERIEEFENLGYFPVPISRCVRIVFTPRFRIMERARPRPYEYLFPAIVELDHDLLVGAFSADFWADDVLRLYDDANTVLADGQGAIELADEMQHLKCQIDFSRGHGNLVYKAAIAFDGPTVINSTLAIEEYDLRQMCTKLYRLLRHCLPNLELK